MIAPGHAFSGHYDGDGDAEIEAMMIGLSREEGAGLLVLPENAVIVHRHAIITLAADQNELFRRAASYADRILKGAKPAGMPVQNPDKFELVIKLKTAQALDITVAPSLLATTDEVIE